MDYPLPIITPRLILRPPQDSDAPAVQATKEAMWHDLQMWMSWSFDNQYGIEALKEYFQRCKEMQTKGDLPLLGFLKEGGAYAVSTGIHMREGFPNTYNTGYWVSGSAQGQGIATEATNAVIRYAFSVMDAKEMHISYYEGNEKSRRVIEKLNFTPNGTREKAEKRCLDGTPLDVHDFVMTDPSVLPPLDVRWGEDAV